MLDREAGMYKGPRFYSQPCEPGWGNPTLIIFLVYLSLCPAKAVVCTLPLALQLSLY